MGRSARRLCWGAGTLHLSSAAGPVGIGGRYFKRAVRAAADWRDRHSAIGHSAQRLVGVPNSLGGLGGQSGHVFCGLLAAARHDGDLLPNATDSGDSDGATAGIAAAIATPRAAVLKRDSTRCGGLLAAFGRLRIGSAPAVSHRGLYLAIPEAEVPGSIARHSGATGAAVG